MRRLTVVLVCAVLTACAAGPDTRERATPGTSGSPDPVLTSTTMAPQEVEPRPDGGYSDSVRGVLTFRGNKTRTFHGTGPVGGSAEVAWKYPRARMCGSSSEYGEIRTWCGTGWAGQPVVFERRGRTWVAFGAYDYSFHFLDADTGEVLLEPLRTGDIAKGMLSVDPDGYPLLYGGSRDNYLRVISIDGGEAKVLWQLDARSFAERKWNNDWDSSALVHRGHLVATGENGRVHVIRLNRGYGEDGEVVVDPEVVWSAPGWDAELLSAIGDQRVSIESSPTLVGETVYFVNSGGLLQGWDLSSVFDGGTTAERVMRLWVGDDADATVVADADGFLYVAVEVDRNTKRGRDIGQLLKVDPRDGRIVWGVDVHHGRDSGSWSTPALWEETAIFTTKPGEVLGVDQKTGAVLWKLRVGGNTLSSPVVVGDVLLQGDGGGILRAFDLSAESGPSEIWRVKLGGNIESTPVVWRGSVWVGSRDGYFYKIETR